MNKSKVICDNNTQTNLHSAFESDKTNTVYSKSLLIKLSEDSDDDSDSDNHSQHTDYTI